MCYIIVLQYKNTVHALLTSSAKQQFLGNGCYGNICLGKIYVGSRVVDGEDIWKMGNETSPGLYYCDLSA